MKKFIFDVDGTLTPSRQRINQEFAVYFSKFCEDNLVYLVTGSDKSKTVEQVGLYIFHKAQKVYNCSGNDVYRGDLNVRRSKWILPEDAHHWLSEQLTASAFSLRTGLHFEHRPGMLNFSVVGRNANQEQRKMYVAWDEKYNERDLIAHNFNTVFPELEARPGGETGIDIAPKGNDKSQILIDFDSQDEIHFYGDRMDEYGNDYPLKKKIIDNDLGFCYTVKGWDHTWELLKHHE